ncbi:MAG TPA: class I adenylate-forming enzyme family protein [Acidimicrobiales bacterium]|nr:class I adenylate-forming enzyme family protein [Acidimicrobiales bacterium]
MTQLLTDQLRLMADHFPNAIGYQNLDRNEALTFADWESLSNQLARGLTGAGVDQGDRVSIFVLPDEVLDWLVAYAAIHKAGAVAVPTSTRLVARELEYVLGHAEAVAALVSEQLLPVLDEARPQLPTLKLVATPDWSDLLDRDASGYQVPVGPDDMADIMYTSGTTGRPKGVVVRHRNAALMPNGLPQWTGTGWLHASPLFTFAGIASVYNPMKLGLTGLFLPKFDAGRWLEVVQRERPTAVFLVPAMAQLVLVHPDFDTADLSSIRLCSLGSAPLAPETQRRLQERMPDATVSNGYGMTEAGPAYCSLPKEEASRRVGSVGKPLPPVEFRVVDEEGVELPARTIGELVIRMPGREREYYRDPEATAETWHPDGLHSGDLAYLDEDGYLYIVGRKKDMIIRGGNNIHAADVEAVLFEHPAVQEAAVAGIPHQVLGEDVAAWVVPKPGVDVTADELRAFCATRIADYKVPRHIRFTTELPRNATGKVVKADLVKGLGHG